MSPRKKTTRSSAGGSNNVILFFAIVLVLAIISVVAAYYLSGEENKQENETTVGNNPIEGTWVSNYNGTMLTIEGLTITVESPSVNESHKVTGKISIEENIVTFTYENGSCKDIEGHYLYSINEKKELFFKLIKDSCPHRLEVMTMTWFAL